MEFALAAPDIDTSLQRLLDGFVLELRNPAERRWRHLAVQLWAESLSNPRLKREALAGVSQAVDVLSRDDRASAKQGKLAEASRSGFRRPCHDRHSSGHFVATGVGRARRYRTLCRGAADRCSIPPRTSPAEPPGALEPASMSAEFPQRRGQPSGLVTMHRSDIFPACQNHGTGGASDPPTQSRAELQTRRRQWDKTSEVPEVHGASRWWALSKAVKPHFLKPYWRARAPSATPAASMPELPSAMPAPRRATTRWASASAPPPPVSWATATLLSIVPARSSSRMTCAPRFRRSMPRSWSARRTRRSCRNCRSSCASSRIWAFRAFCF